MIYLLTLAAAQAASPGVEAVPDESDPIVVIGRRLESIEVRVGRDPQGSWHCSMDGSTGRLSLDKKLCKAVTKCVRKGATSDVSIRDCVTTTKRKLMRDIKRERRRK
ncbi:MAG: hypothetical protein R3E14_06750 [Erythrobacter sp.]